MYQLNQGNDNTEKSKTTVLYVKIGLAIAILALGAYIILWSTEIIEHLITSENTSVINAFLNQGSNQEFFSVSYSNDSFIIENNDAFKLIFLMFIFIVLFNIIGRAISGLFSCLASIIVGLNVNSDKSDENNK